jgi:hypothetical protein
MTLEGFVTIHMPIKQQHYAQKQLHLQHGHLALSGKVYTTA